MDIADLKFKYDLIKTKIDRLVGQRVVIGQDLARAEEKMKAAQSQSLVISDGIALVQKFSESVKTDVVTKFEDLLTRGVRQVYGRDYQIHIEFTPKANTMHADFFATLPGGRVVNLAKGEGGGLSDLVSVLQRILYIVMEPAQPERLLFLDENLKHLDSERSSLAFKFLSKIIQELDIQTVWITHSQAARTMAADGVRVLEVGLVDEKSHIREVKADA